MSKDYRGGQSPAHLFAMELARGLRDGLGEGFVGIYLHGSVATGEDVPGKSDADLIAVCGRPLPERVRDGLRDLLTTSAPLPGLPAVDLGVLTARVAAHPERPVRWELMVRGKCAGDRLVVTNLGGYPGDLLDVELARQHGVALVGPKPRTVFAPVPAAWVLEACAEELRTWVGFCHYNDPSSGVLNACRAWRYAEEGVLSSKAEGGQWARSRTVAPSLIDAALATRRSEAGGAMAEAMSMHLCATRYGLSKMRPGRSIAISQVMVRACPQLW